MRYVDTGDVFVTISFANSIARGNTCSGEGSVSENSELRSGCDAGYVLPVVVRWRALDILAACQYSQHAPNDNINIPNQPRQIKRRTSLHNNSPPRKHEPDLRPFVRNANAHRQRHRNPNPHRTPLQRPNNRLPTPVNRQRHPPASIPVLAHRLLAALERTREVRSRAEDFPVTGDDGAFDAWVDVDEGEGVHELVHHCVGEGIVAAGAVEGYEDGWGGSGRVGGDVREEDFFEWEIFVGVWEGDFGGDGGHVGVSCCWVCVSEVCLVEQIGGECETVDL
jgi:hypothetical protein